MWFLIVAILSLVITGIIGQIITDNHRKDIEVREQELAHIILLADEVSPECQQAVNGVLVSGATVMSCGHFKQWIASFRLFFGGRVRSYEDMVDLGRRESILRMKAQAAAMGAKTIANVKMQTADLAPQRQNVSMQELLVYGTALFED